MHPGRYCAQKDSDSRCVPVVVAGSVVANTAAIVADLAVEIVAAPLEEAATAGVEPGRYSVSPGHFHSAPEVAAEQAVVAVQAAVVAPPGLAVQAAAEVAALRYCSFGYLLDLQHSYFGSYYLERHP